MSRQNRRKNLRDEEHGRKDSFTHSLSDEGNFITPLKHIKEVSVFNRGDKITPNITSRKAERECKHYGKHNYQRKDHEERTH